MESSIIESNENQNESSVDALNHVQDATQIETVESTNNKVVDSEKVVKKSLKFLGYNDGTSIDIQNDFEQIKDIFVEMNEIHQWVPEYKYQKKIKENDLLMTDLKKEVSDLKDQVKMHKDHSSSYRLEAEQNMIKLKNENEKKLKELNCKLALVTNNQQNSVMNFARKEKEILDLQKNKTLNEDKIKTFTKEREKLINQMKSVRSELNKTKSLLEKKTAENILLNQEKQKYKDEIDSHIIKVKWSQNKLKSEVESHKETKDKFEKIQLEVQQAKEETEQIRKNCQNMIKTYQENEEIKSNSLDIQLKDKIQILKEKEIELKELEEIHKSKSEEMNCLKEKHKNLIEENTVCLARLNLWEKERNENLVVLRNYEELMNKQKLNASQLNERLNCMEELKNEKDELNVMIDELNKSLVVKDNEKEAILEDLERRKIKEQELRLFTEKVSSKNSELTVAVDELKNKAEQLIKAEEEIIELKNERLKMAVERKTTEKNKEDLIEELTMKLEDKEKALCQMTLNIEEQKDEIKTIRRKNIGKIKDLTRQLQQAKKKIENKINSQNSNQQNTSEIISLGSRTSSNTSLDKISVETSSMTNGVCEHDLVPATAIAGSDNFDRQMFIERIVRLQQIHAKKNEKIDFLNEHADSLLDELKRKQKIIENYILREEAGVLAPPKNRDNRGRVRPPALTLDLSMEINRKMQSVLEDTILKNITLKESLELMGREIERLQEK